VRQQARRAGAAAAGGAVQRVERGVARVEGQLDAAWANEVAFCVEAVARDVLQGGALRRRERDCATLAEEGAVERDCWLVLAVVGLSIREE